MDRQHANRQEDAFIGSLLTWERPQALDESLDRARGRYLGRMASQLSAVLAELSEFGHEQRASALRAGLAELPVEALFSLLLAPETHRRVTLPLRSGSSLLAFLESALAAEACQAGQRPPPTRGVWTADGARFFKASGPRRRDQPAWAAPIVASRTIVDVASPHARLSERNNVSTRRVAAERLLDGGDLDGALAKLQAALGAIEQTSAAAYSLVSRLLRVLVLTRHPQHDHIFQSVSTRAVVGRAVIVNAHRDHATIARIADALVHEAIHAFLYENEQAGRWVRGASQKRDIVSPWTGNRLTLDSYLHACFVWFALGRFWALPDAGAAFPEAEARGLSERARRGFAGDKIADTIGRRSGSLRDGIPDQVRWLIAHAG